MIRLCDHFNKLRGQFNSFRWIKYVVTLGLYPLDVKDMVLKANHVFNYKELAQLHGISSQYRWIVTNGLK
jgi:hypothetical protein